MENVVVLSTDKAAYPINAMGISKALMEKVAISKGRELGEGAATTICCTRYGNVMASRGSVIPLWVEQMMEGKPITITDPNMTRFMMTLDDAVDLVVYAFQHGHNGDLFVQKAPAATLSTLALPSWILRSWERRFFPMKPLAPVTNMFILCGAAGCQKEMPRRNEM